MKKIIYSIFLIYILINTSINYSVFAKEETPDNMTPFPQPTIVYILPYPGILPDHPLYFVKNIRDKIIIFFNRKPVKKSQICLLLSDKNLVMGVNLWEKGEYGLSIKSLENSEEYIIDSIEALIKVNFKEIPPGVVDKIKLAIQKHEEVIQNIKGNPNSRDYMTELNKIIQITNQAKKEISLIK
jgi:hypothetical protein